MANLNIFWIVVSAFLVSVFADSSCKWYPYTSAEDPSYETCSYGCCYTYIRPCCAKPVGIILAETFGIIGGVVLIIVIVVIVVLYRCRLRLRNTNTTGVVVNAGAPPPPGYYVAQQYVGPAGYPQQLNMSGFQQQTNPAGFQQQANPGNQQPVNPPAYHQVTCPVGNQQQTSPVGGQQEAGPAYQVKASTVADQQH